ncbi:MAG: DUF211 domain-containing protein [Pseudomonadota bacterium]
MITVKRVTLDVLKPHQPNALEFAQAIAALGPDLRVKVTVEEVDEKTETLQVVVEATNIDFPEVHEAINKLGGSLHSIDEVEVHGDSDQT